MQAPEVIRRVGDPDPLRKIAHHAGDDGVARLLLVACGLDKASGRTMGGIGAVPDFRPAKDGQRGTRQASLGRFDQIELTGAILVGFIAGSAELKGHGDMAVERKNTVLQRIGLLDDLERIARIALVKGLPD